MEPSPSDRTPHIPGIDTVELMERIGEDTELLWEILGEFSRAYRDFPARIAAALNQDPAEAKQLAHTLKGVLGNLSANTLFAACKALDDAIREGRAASYPELLATLARDVPALCDAIDRARPTQDAEPGPAPGSVWLETRYAELRAALEGHRARECKAIVEEIAAASLPAPEQSFFEALQAHVRAYRFKDAQALLDRRAPHAA